MTVYCFAKGGTSARRCQAAPTAHAAHENRVAPSVSSVQQRHWTVTRREPFPAHEPPSLAVRKWPISITRLPIQADRSAAERRTRALRSHRAVGTGQGGRIPKGVGGRSRAREAGRTCSSSASGTSSAGGRRPRPAAPPPSPPPVSFGLCPCPGAGQRRLPLLRWPERRPHSCARLPPAALMAASRCSAGDKARASLAGVSRFSQPVRSADSIAERSAAISRSDSSFQLPGERPESEIDITDVLCRPVTSWPTAANIRLICRLRPSLMVSSTALGVPRARLASQGRVLAVRSLARPSRLASVVITTPSLRRRSSPSATGSLVRTR
mmetsp:Transcript_15078/g.35930  ORF Transcript_15078/g.35930 Transcript_15078/m.35930 type:complete len:325 (+) Transcript_15078:1046-2020(+)